VSALPVLATQWLARPIAYDGSQLRSHWILAEAGLVGDVLVGFRGPCNVLLDEMADLADLDGPGIRADDMVHFVWESFREPDLLLAVHRQRLLSAQAAELLQVMAAPGTRVVRSGDDLFVGDGKLSISIATVSPVSSLVHFALNATQGGAPVRTAALVELGVDPDAYGRRLLDVVAAEQASIQDARAKVRPKGAWQS
jgi:hypothetical protein